MGEKIMIIRKALNLNQTNFGARLGVKAAAISKIESGERNLTEQMILAICREFNVNEDWLRTGNGEMFKEANAVERLAAEFGLDEFAIRTLRAYQQLTPANREVIKGFIHKISAETAAETSPAPTQEELNIKEQAALLRARADALEKGLVESTILEKDA